MLVLFEQLYLLKLRERERERERESTLFFSQSVIIHLIIFNY